MGAVGATRDAFEEFAPTLLEEPLLTAGVLAVLFLLLTLGGLVVRYLRRPPGKRFAGLIGKYDAVAVLMHPDPDPDAISCALAVKEIATSRGTDATLYYSGEIRHHENRAFETVLDIDLKKIKSKADINEDEIILVDHNRPRNFQGAEAIEPLAVVDHHPGVGTGRKFTDIRTDYGACASILTEYFEELGWNPVRPADVDEDEEPETAEGVVSPITATALVHGIQSDTKSLTKGCSVDDFNAAAFLYPGIDNSKLDRIANPDVDPDSLDAKARAITERDVRSAFAVSDVGTVSNTDSIPQCADELLRLEGVNAVVVLGDKEGEIRLAGRSKDDRVHMGHAIEAVVDDIPMGKGGGHPQMGGGKCSIEHMEGLGPGDGISRDELHERLFAAMNGEL